MDQVLLNIVRVQALHPHQIANITKVPGGILLNYWRDWRDLPATGLSDYSVTSSITNKSRVFTHKLTAFLSSSFDVNNKKWCFLATAADGTRYLIGAPERPYPIVTTVDSLPGKETDKSGCELTVTYISAFGLLPVLD